MTWVVGCNSIFGTAFLVGDIRVTFSDGRTFDCLQKTHYLSNYVAGAFAGSVRLGFQMVDVLRQELSGVAPGDAWDLPHISATWLPRVLRHAFTLAPEADRKLGCSLMLAAAHPTELAGPPSFPFHRTHICTFRAPSFQPAVTAGLHPVAIGSGADVEDYRRAVAEVTSQDGFHKMGMGDRSAQLRCFMFDLYRLVSKLPTPTVSPLFAAAFVELSRVRLIPLAWEEITETGAVPIALPNLAPTYEVFASMCADRGIPSATLGTAVC